MEVQKSQSHYPNSSLLLFLAGKVHISPAGSAKQKREEKNQGKKEEKQQHRIYFAVVPTDSGLHSLFVYRPVLLLSALHKNPLGIQHLIYNIERKRKKKLRCFEGRGWTSF